MTVKATYLSPVGLLTIAVEGNGLIGLWMADQRHFGAGLPADAVDCPGHPLLVRIAQWLDRYFAGKRPSIAELPLTPKGTPFQQRIWKALCEIPYGETVTYGSLARHLGTKGVQAVGSAVGRNPIGIIIPCHRVVGAKGLGGYAGGPERKQQLLNLERG